MDLALHYLQPPPNITEVILGRDKPRKLLISDLNSIFEGSFIVWAYQLLSRNVRLAFKIDTEGILAGWRSQTDVPYTWRLHRHQTTASQAASLG
jgi:hypothetical protein